MPALVQAACSNRLLALMTPADFECLAPALERVPMPRGSTVNEAAVPIEHVYFLEEGIASILAASPEGLEIEAGLFGRDGFGPLAAVMGADSSPHHTTIQVPGEALRIPRGVLVDAADARATLRRLLLRFVQVMAIQTSFTALSNAVHPVEERLARWLLMCHDRHPSDELPLTHDFLSIMLAVRRPSVTTALHVLEGNRFITAERGRITIRHRHKLEQFAGDGYGRPEAEYMRLIGPMS